MIKQIYLKTRDDGIEIWRTFSDQKFVIQNTNTKEVFDIVDDPYEMLSQRPYIELNILIKEFFAISPEEEETQNVESFILD